ncbi:MAG: hypothetical protein ACTSUE_22635 [Promethearchaeota archaeon]
MKNYYKLDVNHRLEKAGNCPFKATIEDEPVKDAFHDLHPHLINDGNQ